MNIVKNKDLPYNKNLRKYAAELRKAGNLSEVLLWLQLKNKQLLGLNFDRQRIIGDYIVDFYCPERRAVIEIDGCSHDERKADYDEARDKYLKSLGLTVIHILDHEVKGKMKEVMEYLENFFLGRHEPA